MSSPALSEQEAELDAQRARWRAEYARRKNYFKEYAARNSNRRKQTSQEYRQKNRQAYNEYARQYRAEHGAKCRAWVRVAKPANEPRVMTFDELKSRFMQWRDRQ